MSCALAIDKMRLVAYLSNPHSNVPRFSAELGPLNSPPSSTPPPPSGLPGGGERWLGAVLWPRQPKLKIVTLLAPNGNETAQPSLARAQPRVLLESASTKCSLARYLKCLLRAVLCPATTWINRWHTSLMRPNLNWNLLDSSWRYCLKAGRLREVRQEGSKRN